MAILSDKDTGDVVEEVLILEAALLTDLINGFQEQRLALWPIVLQEDHHVTQGEVVSAVREGTKLMKIKNRLFEFKGN